MKTWELDKPFCKLAELIWADDYQLATGWGRPKGGADANRRMKLRHEGYRALTAVVELKLEGQAVVEALRKYLERAEP